jgi:hypothetical protein
LWIKHILIHVKDEIILESTQAFRGAIQEISGRFNHTQSALGSIQHLLIRIAHPYPQHPLQDGFDGV